MIKSVEIRLLAICILLLSLAGHQAINSTAFAFFNKAEAEFSGPLKPFKDNRFSYRKALRVEDDGDFIIAPYDEMRDINKRDQIPVRKVKAGFIKRISKRKIHDFTYQTPNGDFPIYGVGKVSGNAIMTVIYLYGRNGNRKWGFDDERFGGNYNRLKNLMLNSGGTYLSPDFSDFDDKGQADISALIERQRPATKGQLVLACGSMSGLLCWRIMADPKIAPMVDGLVFLGGFPNQNFAARFSNGNISGNKHPAIYIAHGSRDKVYASADMKAFYQQLHSQNYPVRMVEFNSGNHGTPVRMIDWRTALNWIAAKAQN